jgi:hypothetical protein
MTAEKFKRKLGDFNKLYLTKSGFHEIFPGDAFLMIRRSFGTVGTKKAISPFMTGKSPSCVNPNAPFIT